MNEPGIRCVLSIRDLSCPGLKPFSIDLNEGECVVLTGPSGAGKTLLLRAIADLDPNKGSVFLNQVSKNEYTAPEWRRAVCYLSTESGWWADDVGTHFPNHQSAGALLPKLGIGPDALNWQVARLSTGERQRLAFARLILVSPSVMLLDEPTSGLDQESEALVEQILLQKLAEDISILIVTHSSDQANRLAHRCLKMNSGVVSEDTS